MKSDNTTMNKLQSFVLFFVIMALPSLAWGQKKSVAVSAQAGAVMFPRPAHPAAHTSTPSRTSTAGHSTTGARPGTSRPGTTTRTGTTARTSTAGRHRDSRQIEYHGRPRQYYRQARNGGKRRSTRKTGRSNSRQRQPNASRQNGCPERRRSRQHPSQRPNPFR